MKKRKFKRVRKLVNHDVRRDFHSSIKREIKGITKIPLVGNSRIISKSPQSMRLPSLYYPKVENPLKNICEDRKNRRRALFKTGKAGKIKVRFAKWTLKSLIRC